jgi:uncharacterized protein (TIGR00299 family) protein
MRIAYLDCFSGISGDMFLGAAVDAGVPLEKLQSVARSLGLHAELASHRVQRSGISATKIDVLIGGRPDQPIDLEAAPEEHSRQHSHGHTHPHSHSHSHPHEQPQAHQPQDATHTHRGLPEIRELIARAPISAAAQAFAIKTFELLAQAESKIHDRPAESIHFHEVGSEDAIVDIVCAAVAIEHIAAGRWYSSALNVGGGTVQCAHGILPVPAPATAELLRGAPIYSSGIQKELLTPTGAALLKALDVHFEPRPAATLSATGYGAGAREFPGVANVLRLTLGESIEIASAGVSLKQGCRTQDGWPTSAPASPAQMWGTQLPDSIVVLEANLDDMNPQLFSYVQQKLLRAGALDAFGVPVQMKKGRPGLVFTVLAAPSDAEAMSHILLTETTTLGVRIRFEQRRILDRRHVTVASPWGPIRVKLGLLQGEVVNCAPEFEDCRTIAEANSVPLKTVLNEALRLYQSQTPAPAAGSVAIPAMAPAAGSVALPDPAPAAASSAISDTPKSSQS